ncbi:hypothetical protein ABL78_8194 [Leptomonas seymouri]|uniref:Flagellar attachment zone protein 1 conserved domain-containing protein n=1 Tax=Leptomonas seymouri TaxID=5684 RepID=A0A0N1HRC1_LEPSE|nr:hypothetical protein ABL78_8194 [Leptomonas seymouri]|eukprot:KPI82794.1 hypothetical protein ABL78_8194 [Leptomonas seymouri]
MLRSKLRSEKEAQALAEDCGDADGAVVHAARADELRNAIVYVEAVLAAEGQYVDALMLHVEEHVESMKSVRREIASRDEAVTALLEALALASHAAKGVGGFDDAAACSRATLMVDRGVEAEILQMEGDRHLVRAVLGVEEPPSHVDSVTSFVYSTDDVLGLREELTRQRRNAEKLQEELQRAHAAHLVDMRDRAAMMDMYTAEITAMQEELLQARAAEEAARLSSVLEEHHRKQEARQQLDEERALLNAERDVLRAELEKRTLAAEELGQEVVGLREAVDVLQWYDERRDYSAKEKPMTVSYLHRIFEGNGWRRVAQDYEEELRWMLRIDCSRACHVSVEHISRTDFVLGSLHVDFCVEHNADVAKSELRDRVAEYPFTSTWGLYYRVLNDHGYVESWFALSSRRIAERLFLEEAAARTEVQLSELGARQEWMRVLNNGTADLLRDHADGLMSKLELAGKECTDNLERLEECAALLEEARESERELRNSLFAASEEIFVLHRKHDEEKRQWEEHEEGCRRALSESVARVAEQDVAIQRQADEVVLLQSELLEITKMLAQKEETMHHLRGREADLLQKLEDGAVEYAEAVKRLDESADALEVLRRKCAALSEKVAGLEVRNDELRCNNEALTDAHRAEMEAATAETEKLKEGVHVMRAFLPQLIAAASGERAKDGGAEPHVAEEEYAASPLSDQLDANELREAFLRLLSQIEQLRCDKVNLSDDLDAAEKLRNDYLLLLEGEQHQLATERALRMRTHEQHVQFTQQLLKQITIMRNSEEDVLDDGYDCEVTSNYEPSSLHSATSPY